jgi:hypothetical protein
MFLLIYFVIIFFILLIAYQVFLSFSNPDFSFGFEGFTSSSYQQYNQDLSNNSPLELQNINNISYLYNEQLDMSGNMAKMQQQINGLVEQQNDYLNQTTGGKPPNITGATDDGEEDNNNSSTND